MFKTCVKCEVKKPLADFYKHAKSFGGYLHQCRECINAARRTGTGYRQVQPRNYTPKGLAKRRRIDAYREMFPEKHKAHKAVETALLFGRLVKQPCEVCGNKKSQAHHDDYSKRLDVRWLCPSHHNELHRQERKAA